MRRPDKCAQDFFAEESFLAAYLRVAIEQQGHKVLGDQLLQLFAEMWAAEKRSLAYRRTRVLTTRQIHQCNRRLWGKKLTLQTTYAHLRTLRACRVVRRIERETYLLDLRPSYALPTPEPSAVSRGNVDNLPNLDLCCRKAAQSRAKTNRGLHHVEQLRSARGRFGQKNHVAKSKQSDAKGSLFVGGKL